MYEIIPIGVGVLLGAFVGSVRAGRASTALVATVALIAGLLAAAISGELEISWTFVMFDVGQVLVAYLMARSLIRRQQKGRAE